MPIDTDPCAIRCIYIYYICVYKNRCTHIILYSIIEYRRLQKKSDVGESDHANKS